MYGSPLSFIAPTLAIFFPLIKTSIFLCLTLLTLIVIALELSLSFNNFNLSLVYFLIEYIIIYYKTIF